MRNPCRLLALCLLLTPLAANAQAAAQPPAQAAAMPEVSPDTYTLREAVPYTEASGAPLVADLYLPKTNAGPYPAIVFIHGGGWTSGDRKQLRRQAMLMASHGFVGMAIEYRLAPAHSFPAPLDDAKTAVRWLRHHAAEYHVDPDRIAAIGSSAGGHLAAMLGVESQPLAPGAHRKGDDASVEAVVAFNGVFDLATMPPGANLTALLGGECAAVKEICNQASPLQHVHPGLPPFLLLHGTADQSAPYTQATAFEAALQKSSDSVTFFTAEGAPHTFWAQPKWMAASFAAMQEFLVKNLRPR